MTISEQKAFADKILKLRADRAMLIEALQQIVKHLETLRDPSAVISGIASEALSQTEGKP